MENVSTTRWLEDERETKWSENRRKEAQFQADRALNRAVIGFAGLFAQVIDMERQIEGEPTGLLAALRNPSIEPEPDERRTRRVEWLVVHSGINPETGFLRLYAVPEDAVKSWGIACSALKKDCIRQTLLWRTKPEISWEPDFIRRKSGWSVYSRLAVIDDAASD